MTVIPMHRTAVITQTAHLIAEGLHGVADTAETQGIPSDVAALRRAALTLMQYRDAAASGTPGARALLVAARRMLETTSQEWRGNAYAVDALIILASANRVRTTRN